MATTEGGLAAIEAGAEGYEEVVVDLGDIKGEAAADGAHSGQEALTTDELRRTFGPLVRHYCLLPAMQDVQDALYPLAEAIETGRRPTATEIDAAREALQHARALVEDRLAPLAPGCEPWGDGVGSRVPNGVMAEQLAQAGYIVEHDDSA